MTDTWSMDDPQSYESVQIWLAAADLAADSQQVEALAEFCADYQANPDELIAKCLSLQPDGLYKVKMKSRREIADAIHERQVRWNDRRRANWLRSFFIHNGVEMQATGVWPPVGI